MSRGIIYLILNKQTSEKYVGNTTLAMNKEWVHHIERSKRMSSEPLHKAFRQYGVHNFMIKELDEYDDTCLENKLNEWIEKYKPEYNPIVIPAEGISASADAEKAEESMQEKWESAGLSDSEVLIPKPKPKNKRNISTSHLISWNDSIRGDGKHCGIKIRGKNLETGLCKDYESARVAAIEVTGDPNTNRNILNAARSGIIAYGHRWQILEEKQKKKAVFGVNKKTGLIGPRYESINAAVRAFECTDKHSILKSLKNPGKYSWKSYFWFFG
jgi:group I intron endonuclease